MLNRESKKSSSARNSPTYLKKKLSFAEADELDCFSTVNETEFFDKNGKIVKKYQDNYVRAIEYVNKCNNLMNRYLTRMKDARKKLGKPENSLENLKITSIPDFMAFFTSVTQREQNDTTNIYIPETKTSCTQTERISVFEYRNKRLAGRTSPQKSFSKLSNVDEDLSEVENIPNITRNIQQSQYRKYPMKQQREPNFSQLGKSKILQTRDQKRNLASSSRLMMRSESNIRDSVASNLLQSDCHQPSTSTGTNSINPPPKNSKSSLKTHQSISCFSKTSSTTALPNNRPNTGLLSNNGMIASEINAKGTPLIVKNMFEEIQNPVSVFLSKGNILKNIARRSGSSSSSVILTDKESEDEFKVNDIDLDYDRQSTYDYKQDEDEPLMDEEGDEGEAAVGGEEQLSDHHPLDLNERDLNSKNRDFINSIGIFTEKGELKPDAKNYLQTKGAVKKGRFRAPRISHLMTRNIPSKSYTSGSTSDNVSIQSSDVRYDV